MKYPRFGAGTPHAEGRRGSALVLSLAAVTTVVVLAAGFSQFASAVANRQAQAVNRKRAFYLAEAGLAEAFAGFTCGRSGNVGTEEQPALLGEGVFWTEATEIEPGIFRLHSTGMAGTGRAELSLVVEAGKDSVAKLGVFSNGDVSLAAGSLIDAYDSSKGTYTDQKDHTGATIGSNAAIDVTGTVMAPTTIKGDVTPGPEGDVATTGEVTITGATGAALAATELPPVLTPAVSLEPAATHDSPYPMVIAAGSVGYEGLSVATGAEVIIQGPAQVVLGSLALASQAQLTFDTTQGAIELYVTDGLVLENGSLLVNSSQKPEDVLIQVPGETQDPVELKSSGAFHGVFFAPDAQVNVGSTFELYGALVADALVFDGPAKLHFDLDLAATAAEQALPKVLTWRLLELSSATTDLSQDPFEILGVDKNTLPTPWDAHEDQVLTIDYIDQFDVYRRYSGAESNFDWSTVKTVLTAERDGEVVLFPRTTTMKYGQVKDPGMSPVVN